LKQRLEPLLEFTAVFRRRQSGRPCRARFNWRVLQGEGTSPLTMRCGQTPPRFAGFCHTRFTDQHRVCSWCGGLTDLLMGAPGFPHRGRITRIELALARAALVEDHGLFLQGFVWCPRVLIGSPSGASHRIDRLPLVLRAASMRATARAAGGPQDAHRLPGPTSRCSIEREAVCELLLETPQPDRAGR